MNRSNSVPLGPSINKDNTQTSTTTETPRDTNKNLYGIEECSRNSLYQLSHNDDKEELIRIQSQLSIENNYSELASSSLHNKKSENQNLESILMPRSVSRKIKQDKNDPCRVIKITEIIEINNKNIKQSKQQDHQLNINSCYNNNRYDNSMRSIQNMNYKVSPNGSLYEVNNEQIYGNPIVDMMQDLANNEPDLAELKRRNETLENEIKLMKDKFSESQLMLQLFKSESMLNKPIVENCDEDLFVPVVHNFSFMKQNSAISSSSQPKRVFVKVIGRTRSQSNDKLGLTCNNKSNTIKQRAAELLDQTNPRANESGDLYKNESIWANRQQKPAVFYKNEHSKNSPIINEVSENEFTNNDTEDQKRSRLQSNYIDSETSANKATLTVDESSMNKKFDLENFKFYLKQLNNYENCSSTNRSSSMPASQLRKNMNQPKNPQEDPKYNIMELKPTFKSKPLKSIITPKWMESPSEATNNSFEENSSFFTNQHISLVRNAGEIINRQKSAFSTVNGQHATNIKQLNSVNGNKNSVSGDQINDKALTTDERQTNLTMTSESVKEIDPVWSHRNNLSSLDSRADKKIIKNYESLKRPNLIANQKNNSSLNPNSFSCGLLNKFFISEASKYKQLNENNTNTEKTLSPKENNYLYREEDENYAKNNSPSLSVASTVGDDDIDENSLKPSSSKSKSQEALNSQQKILNMIEDYLNRNSDENSLNSLTVNKVKPDASDNSSVKKIEENHLTSPKNSRESKPVKKVNSYYNEFYKEQSNNSSKVDNTSKELPPIDMNKDQISSIGFVSKYIDEEDYSDDYNDLIKRSPNEEIREFPDQPTLSTFLTNKSQDPNQANETSFLSNRTPKLARRVAFADEVVD